MRGQRRQNDSLGRLRVEVGIIAAALVAKDLPICHFQIGLLKENKKQISKTFVIPFYLELLRMQLKITSMDHRMEISADGLPAHPEGQYGLHEGKKSNF